MSCTFVGVPDSTDELKILCQEDCVTIVSSEEISYLFEKNNQLEFVANTFTTDLTLEKFLYFKK